MINTVNTCSEQSQTDVLGTVTGELEPETQLSEPVSDDLASTINKIFSMPLQKDKLITRLNSCLPPSNTDTMTLKKCNEEIWGSNQNFMPQIRSNDIKLQTVQQCLLKSLVPLVKFSDTVLKAKLSGLKIDPDEALKACMDTIVLASNASQKEINIGGTSSSQHCLKTSRLLPQMCHQQPNFCLVTTYQQPLRQ